MRAPHPLLPSKREDQQSPSPDVMIFSEQASLDSWRSLEDAWNWVQRITLYNGMCAYVHVSTHLPVHVCLSMCMCVLMHMHVSLSMCLHVCVPACVYIYLCVYVCVCSLVYVFMCIHLCVYIYVCICIHVHLWVSMYRNICVYRCGDTCLCIGACSVTVCLCEYERLCIC